VWDSIKDNPPVELKISPIAAIPHKSKQFCSILDLSFNLRLKQGGIVPSVNATTIKTAPKGAIDQIGHSLTHIIHAFAEAEEDTCIIMAKWDIKDGFWRLDAEDGAEWNFHMCCPNTPASPATSWYPPHFRWDGSNHLHFSVQHQKRQGTLRKTIVKQKLELYPLTNSPTT